MSSREFWIDVGGTFTDSFALAPDGTLAHYKMLSSGVVKGAIGPGSSRQRIVDAARRLDPKQIWSDFRFRLLDERGGTRFETTVARFTPATATFELAQPLPEKPKAGQRY
jgi:5-oxoprolinase (ATP-hydrolysing)